VLTNCVVRDSGSYGVYVRNTSSGHSVSLTNCTLHDNGIYGVYSGASAGNAATITITNAIVTSSSYGIYRGDQATYAVTYSNVWNNTSGDYVGVTAGTGTISANPQYVSATDLHLQGSSVSIDAGTTGPTADADGVTRPLDGNGIGGAQWDMGAYEFVLMAECGNGATEPGEACDSGANNGMYGHCNATCTAQGPRCGDTMVNGPEQCDDGNTVNSDACLNTCQNATCGDGVVQAGAEACDDGNTIATDACTATCTVAACGDGVVQAGVEACDDGNTANTDACVDACVAATCGDGYIHDGVEGCDDGNTSDGDACGSTCVSTTCGDGVVQPGVEECDDGNVAPGDGCSPGCRAELGGPDAGAGTDGGSIDEPAPGGCCQTSDRGAAGSLALAGFVMLVVGRRRR
jgi:uncharacterized protein (TIGR03382 family)